MKNRRTLDAYCRNAVCKIHLSSFDPTFVHKVCMKTVSHWCVSSCAGAGLSYSWRQSCSLDTCEDEGRNVAPCESEIKKVIVIVRNYRSQNISSLTMHEGGHRKTLITDVETVLRNFEELTLTSGQEVEVKSQSGHLKVLGSKCAFLWFSMSERPWKDSMQIRHENLLALRLGEVSREGEAGDSELSCQKQKPNNTVREWWYWTIHVYMEMVQSVVTSTCCNTPSGSAEVM